MQSPPRPRSRQRSSSRTRRLSTSREKTPSPIPEGCICHREYGTVMCTMCGWIHPNARVRQPCPVHARTIYLLDIDQCPKCRAYPPILQELVMTTKP